MDAQRKRPMLVTAFVAIVGTAVILLNDFNPDTDPRSGGNVMAITAAAVSRAGTIEIPTESSVGSKVF